MLKRFILYSLSDQRLNKLHDSYTFFLILTFSLHFFSRYLSIFLFYIDTFDIQKYRYVSIFIDDIPITRINNTLCSSVLLLWSRHYQICIGSNTRKPGADSNQEQNSKFWTNKLTMHFLSFLEKLIQDLADHYIYFGTYFIFCSSVVSRDSYRCTWIAQLINYLPLPLCIFTLQIFFGLLVNFCSGVCLSSKFELNYIF